MRDYTQRFSEGERTLAERYLTDEEFAIKEREARRQRKERLERERQYNETIINEGWLPF